ncbi:MAG: Ig-like domain-containing protein, partial [Candidatus Woesebacteria bacterium]|nr:Ig-like domain-containing protein [Candidatus Woesebacteria bacterium]
HNVRVWANDSAGNYNSTIQYWTTDGTAPTFTAFVALTETTNSYTQKNYIVLNFTFTETNPSVCTVTIGGTNYTGTIQTGTSCWYNKTSLADGNYISYVYLNDTAGNVMTRGTHNVTIDTTLPTLSISLPTNTTYSNSNNISVNFSLSGTDSGTYCWNQTDGGTNSTPSTSCSNFTLSSLSNGVHNLTLYFNKSFGELKSNTTFFTIDFFVLNNSNTLPAIATFYFTQLDTNQSTEKRISTSSYPITWSYFNATVQVNNTQNLYLGNINFSIDKIITGADYNYTYSNGTINLNMTANQVLNLTNIRWREPALTATETIVTNTLTAYEKWITVSATDNKWNNSKAQVAINPAFTGYKVFILCSPLWADTTIQLQLDTYCPTENYTTSDFNTSISTNYVNFTVPKFSTRVFAASSTSPSSYTPPSGGGGGGGVPSLPLTIIVQQGALTYPKINSRPIIFMPWEYVKNQEVPFTIRSDADKSFVLTCEVQGNLANYVKNESIQQSKNLPLGGEVTYLFPIVLTYDTPDISGSIACNAENVTAAYVVNNWQYLRFFIPTSEFSTNSVKTLPIKLYGSFVHLNSKNTANGILILPLILFVLIYLLFKKKNGKSLVMEYAK